MRSLPVGLMHSLSPCPDLPLPSPKPLQATKKRRHAHDLAMEKQAREAAQQKAEKAAAKLEHKAATQGGVVKPKRKSKAIRIRKGVKVKVGVHCAQALAAVPP